MRSRACSDTGYASQQLARTQLATCYLCTVIDDHSRVAYVEARDDETQETATEVLENALAWFAGRGVIMKRVISDNGAS